MKVKKRLGIWMDHSTACWMEYNVDSFEVNTIAADNDVLVNQQPEHRFDAIKIETKSATKMSYKEQHAFMKDYFAKLLNYESTYSK